VPPLGVLLLVPLSVIWLMATVLYSLWGDFSPRTAIILALAGGVCPMLAAYGVVTNRRWTRALVIIAIPITIYVIGVNQGMSLESMGTAPAMACLWLSWGVLVGYLYFSRRARVYYLLIAGRPLPKELATIDLMPPLWFQRVIGLVPAIAEVALIILALALFFGVFLAISDGPWRR
jgi:hypothetical protein